MRQFPRLLRKKILKGPSELNTENLTAQHALCMKWKVLLWKIAPVRQQPCILQTLFYLLLLFTCCIKLHVCDMNWLTRRGLRSCEQLPFAFPLLYTREREPQPAISTFSFEHVYERNVTEEALYKRDKLSMALTEVKRLKQIEDH